MLSSKANPCPCAADPFAFQSQGNSRCPLELCMGDLSCRKRNKTSCGCGQSPLAIASSLAHGEQQATRPSALPYCSLRSKKESRSLPGPRIYTGTLNRSSRESSGLRHLISSGWLLKWRTEGLASCSSPRGYLLPRVIIPVPHFRWEKTARGAAPGHTHQPLLVQHSPAVFAASPLH